MNRYLGLTFIVVAVLAAPAASDEERVASRILRELASGRVSEESIGSAILTPWLDEWRIAERVLILGNDRARRAIVGSLQNHDGYAALTAYARGRLPHQFDRQLLSLHDAIRAARLSDNPQKAIEAAPDRVPVTAVGVMIEEELWKSYRSMGAQTEMTRHAIGCARRARDLGWPAAANRALRHLVGSAIRPPGYDSPIPFLGDPLLTHLSRGVSASRAFIVLGKIHEEVVGICVERGRIRFVVVASARELRSWAAAAHPDAPTFLEAGERMRHLLEQRLPLPKEIRSVVVCIGPKLESAAQIPWCMAWPGRAVSYWPLQKAWSFRRPATPVAPRAGTIVLGVPTASGLPPPVIREWSARWILLDPGRGLAKAVADLAPVRVACVLAQSATRRSRELVFGLRGAVTPLRAQTLRVFEDRADLLVLFADYSARLAPNRPLPSAADAALEALRNRNASPEQVRGALEELRRLGARVAAGRFQPPYLVIDRSPRVLVHLWKIDQAASAELMRQVFRTWNTREGSQQCSLTESLRRAQERLAGRAAWRHPRYWAGWQLWGIPE